MECDPHPDPAAPGSPQEVHKMAFRTIAEAQARAMLANEEADMLPFQFVNEQGIKEIENFLAFHHKKGHHQDAKAWATDAEFQLSEGNPASIEIKSWASQSGHTETFNVSPGGVSWGIND